MDLRQLKYFVKIVEQRSMSRASVELHVAQSALSSQIASLETRLRQKLLIRRSTGVVPTEAGQALYKHAVAILRQVERATHDVERSGGEPSGPASLGLPVVVEDLLALDLFVAARARLPQVTLHLSEGMSYLLKEMVLQGRLDMTVTYQFEPSPGIVEHPLFTEMIYLVSPAKSGVKPHKEMSLAQAVQYPLVLSSPQTAMRRVVQAGLAAANLTVTALAEIDSLKTLVDVVEQGHAHTVLPASALQRQLKTDGGDSLVLTPLDISRNVVLCTSEHLPLGVAGTAVYELLEDVVRKALKERRWLGIGPSTGSPSG
ncbi:LysR family transcriptional regulator [Hydrogenophaga aromaticivorans]|uniref:LysR substrate-binding domain-containing protein n=1 Tax=Hydrogenophaga aromaticivorans TaxID=2610898 RepID=UPI001B384599|nr:LysR substrate-binding domain-containing protein [Hydrogenophaga aromaticivorans]MBQ0921949.1 LysR family transcriptional regulator [Hydrogenophaga aromaticivorans]